MLEKEWTVGCEARMRGERQRQPSYDGGVGKQTVVRRVRVVGTVEMLAKLICEGRRGQLFIVSTFSS